MNTRQVRTFTANNRYVQEYYASMDRKYPRGTITTPYGNFDVATYRRNTGSYYAWKAIAEKFPKVFETYQGGSFHINHTYTLVIDREEYDLDFSIIARIDWKGGYTINIQPCNNNARFYEESCQRYTEDIAWNKESIIQKVEAIIRSRLLGTGFFARVQLYYHIPKEQLKERVKQLYKASKQSSIDINKLHKWIKRNFNIDGSNVWDEQKLVEAVNTHGRQQKLVRLAFYNSSWFNDFEGDLDELETEFYKHIETDTIYI